MKAKTIHLQVESIESAQQLFMKYSHLIEADRKQKGMPGRAGENHILRRAVELGIPLVAKELLKFSQN